MKNRRTMVVAVLVLLVVSIAWLFPTVAGGKENNGLAQRVEVLEGQVLDLLARVEALEAHTPPPPPPPPF